MAQFEWEPAGYLRLMHEEVADYERVEDETAAATGSGAGRVLELGTGTGETTRRVLAAHPAAIVVSLDASRQMLEHASAALSPTNRVELHLARLADPLPEGPFDVVVSALTVHHLDSAGKADLFRRVAAVLSPGGRFVLGDVVIPEDPAHAHTPIDGDHDRPSTVADQMRWLAAAGLHPILAWAHHDLVVLIGQAPAA